MADGIIIKGYGSFYFVWDKQLKKELRCKARGRFKNDKVSLMVGDKVSYIGLTDDEGYIEKVHDRDNYLTRPPVSNIDQVILIFTLKEPNLHMLLLTKHLIAIESHDMKPVVCFNKTDLITDEIKDQIETQLKGSGYPIIFISAKTGEGIKQIESILAGKATVLAGPSGVGKSSLINTLNPILKCKTGKLSDKILRGKQTTRYVELLPVGEDGFIVDTPGFSNIELNLINSSNLKNCFPEFRQYLGKCRFQDCVHISEPNCCIKEGIVKGDINELRYDLYKGIYHEIKGKEANSWH